MPDLHWQDQLIHQATRAVGSHTYWRKHRNEFFGSAGLHLAVFVQPYLDFLLEGRKTIESRFGVQRCAPHGRVAPGDIVFLKVSGGPVVGLCRINEIWSFDLRATSIATIRERFARELCAEDPEFWQAREHATLATLMRVDQVAPTSPIQIPKRDRRGWVTLRCSSPLFAGVEA